MTITGFHCSHGEVKLYAVRTHSICLQYTRGKNIHQDKNVQSTKAKHLSNSVITSYKPIKTLIRISLALTV